MQGYQRILTKLQNFISKYYKQRLLKGIILFLSLGLLLFLLIVGVEYTLWLNKTGRLFLLTFLILIEGFLLFKYILSPIFYLVKIKKGISTKQAALIIGTHFSEVGDKLYNLLELADQPKKSELLLASIEQRSASLNPVAFKKAINYQEVVKYAKLAIVPLLVLITIWISGNWSSFYGSYERVLNYKIAYQPPSPFDFILLNKNLEVLDDQEFTLMVTTKGEVKPEYIYLVLDGKELLMKNQEGSFQYTLSPPHKASKFQLKANNIRSNHYSIKVVSTPTIVDFNIELEYPSYLKKNKETINSTGNLNIPEGTKVTWTVNTKNTDKIGLITNASTLGFTKSEDNFKLDKRIYHDLNYTIATSNSQIEHHDKLNYTIQVKKDDYPKIKVVQTMDTINPAFSYYKGELKDDHGIEKLQLVYYDVLNPAKEKTLMLPIEKSTLETFYYTFPTGIDSLLSNDYAFYFKVTDNDGIHKGKATKSTVFQHKIFNQDELKVHQLNQQQNLIESLKYSVETAKEQKLELQELNNQQKVKNSFNYNDKNLVKDFINKQKQQEAFMQKFSSELRKNIAKDKKNEKLGKLLQERLERQEKEAKKNEKLLEELNRIADKINKEELSKKLEELSKKQQNSERSLAQLLELTKRYYVTEKTAQMAKQLEDLSKSQIELSKDQKQHTESLGQQKNLNKLFEDIEKDLEELEKDNQDLQKPLPLDINKSKTSSIKEDQKKATNGLENKLNPQSSNKIGQQQRSAGQKMEELSKSLQSASSQIGGSGITEDAEMLRQILDNLIIFSFKQETLYDQLSKRNGDNLNNHAVNIKEQQELRNLFEHVDDSLFALSLRQAELAQFTNEQVSEVFYNIDKSLESMAEGQLLQGASRQKYVLNHANSLADFLAKMLENMQQSMQMGKGSGQSQGGFQLPDIIQGQQSLNEKMGKSGSKGQQGQNGKKGGEGKEKGSGEKGENGKKPGESTGDNGENNNRHKGTGKGDSPNGNQQGGGQQNNMTEAELEEVYQIYQEQQQIREALEKQLNDLINNKDRKLGEKIIKQMQDFENDLLENGITAQTITKANNIQYELLKLENAALKQGQKKERESTTNQYNHTNPITTKPVFLDNNRNEVELLNRQSLPLRQNYQNKVNQYFKEDD